MANRRSLLHHEEGWSECSDSEHAGRESEESDGDPTGTPPGFLQPYRRQRKHPGNRGEDARGGVERSGRGSPADCKVPAPEGGQSEPLVVTVTQNGENDSVIPEQPNRLTSWT